MNSHPMSVQGWSGRSAGELFRVRSSWRISGSRAEVFAVVADPARLPEWWGSVFMRVDILGEERQTREGCLVRLYTKGWLPHTFQFLARVSQADESETLSIETLGDFNGRADITMRDEGATQVVDIDWQVRVRQPIIRPLLRLLKPLFVANHRWAMRQGAAGLQAAVQRIRTGIPLPAVAGRPTFPHNIKLLRNAFRFTRVGGGWSS